MNQGGFDLVTASGDASLRLIAGEHGAADQRGPDPELGAPSTSGCRTRRGTPWTASPLRHTLSVGRQRAHVQHRDFPGSAGHLGRHLSSEQNLPDGQSNKGRVQAYDGPIALADAALYLKTHNPELGITDPYALTLPTSMRRPSNWHAASAPWSSRYWHDVTAQMEDFTERRRGRLQLVALPGQPAPGRRRTHRQRDSRPRAPPAGPTPP